MAYREGVKTNNSKEDNRHRYWKVVAQVPLHITGFWSPCIDKDPLFSGSIGAGILLADTVVALCKPSRRAIVEFTAPNTRSPPCSLTRVLELLGHPKVELSVVSPQPLGVGYGVSGAVALAASLAIAVYKGISLNYAARIAHIAEVQCLTGLGDVIAEYEAVMLECRISPGAPGIGYVESYPIDAKHVITVTLAKPMETSVMVKSVPQHLYQKAKRWVEEVSASGDLDLFLEYARSFGLEAGFIDNAKARLLDSLVQRNAIRGWYVKKSVLLVVPEHDRVEDVVDALTSLGRLRTHRVAYERAQVKLVEDP